MLSDIADTGIKLCGWKNCEWKMFLDSYSNKSLQLAFKDQTAVASRS